ncbi:MAG TPA: hypothetical protein VEW42_01595 [Candidatus Eisenbacteria bacterium]|nr:hypothetical protein [Candidatus Eisenbacteria bacterium]
MSTKNALLYISTTLLAFTFVMSLPSPVKALEATGTLNKEARVEARATIAEEKQTNLLAAIKQRGDTMIAQRLTSLQKLSDRISKDKRLSDTDKTTFQNDISTTVSALNALKVKIDADTDVTTARADVKSIVTSYHIYMYFEPKERLLVVINNLLTQSNTITTLQGKVQTLVTDLKNQGKDVTTAQTALSDISTQLTAINTLLTTDKSLVSNVTNATANPQSVFTQVRKDLATVRADFAKIRSDFATIRGSLKILIQVKTGTASQSAK